MTSTAQHLLICRHALRKVPVGRIATLMKLDPATVAEILDRAGYPDLAQVRETTGQLIDLEREIRGVHTRPVLGVDALVRAGRSSTRRRAQMLAERLDSVHRDLLSELDAETQGTKP